MRTTQLGFSVLGAADVVLTAKVPLKVVVSRKPAAPPEPKGLVWLFAQRGGTPKLWGRFVYSLFHFDPADFPRGRYRAQHCTCIVVVNAHGIEPSPCSEHPGLAGAYFVPTAEMGVMGRAWATAQSWYGSLPWAHLPHDGFTALRLLALRPAEYGIDNARELAGKVVTIDKQYGSCGCSYKVKRFDIPGLPWQCRTGHIWLLVKEGECGHKDSCAHPKLPVGRKAVVEINRTIKQYLINY